jgi:septum formation topological specificity factor MinE
MVDERDVMILATAIQDYDKQKANYHFRNEELYLLNRCEKDILGVIDKYASNINALIELCSRVPSVQKFMSKELLQQIQQYTSSMQSEVTVYYSFDGQQFSTIEEAAERNEMLLNSPPSR